MDDRRKENIPVMIDRRKKSDSIVHRAVAIFLQRAVTAQNFISIREELCN